jgi:glycosyltransferase involved in cell wall biosynthesis
MAETFLVVIPAYNAGSTISELIERTSKFAKKSAILVVDDGSDDGTFEISQGAGVVVLSHEDNKGKGEALKTGFKYARQKGYRFLITMDADLQHDPESIPDFIGKASVISTSLSWIKTSPHPNPFPKGERRINSWGIIIGTRRRNLKNMPLARWLTNNLTSAIVSVLSGQSIRDSQSGYRLISTQVLKKIKLESSKYDLESEILIKAARGGFLIREIPVKTIYGKGKSFIHPLRDTGRFVRLMWRSLWW